MYKALRCEFLCMSSCLTWAGFALKVLPFGSKWTLGPHAPFQRDKHSHMLKNPYSSTQPSTRSRQPRLITFPCLWGFFSINFSFSFSQRCSFYSQWALGWQTQLNHYITPQLWWTPYELHREPDSQSEQQPETCVLLYVDRQKRWSEGERELKRGIWRAEWAEICPGARPSTMRNICLTSGRLPRQTPHPCQEW